MYRWSVRCSGEVTESTIRLTFLWLNENRWEGRDYENATENARGNRTQEAQKPKGRTPRGFLYLSCLLFSRSPWEIGRHAKPPSISRNYPGTVRFSYRGGNFALERVCNGGYGTRCSDAEYMHLGHLNVQRRIAFPNSSTFRPFPSRS